MRVFVDRSSVEVFAGSGRSVITDLIFPEGRSDGLEPYARGDRALLRSLEVHEPSSVQK